MFDSVIYARDNDTQYFWVLYFSCDTSRIVFLKYWSFDLNMISACNSNEQLIGCIQKSDLIYEDQLL
jgi:hypothetical protein